MSLILYVPWLLKEVLLSSIDVAYRVLSPSMPIDCEMIEFKSSLESDLGLTIYANSITLTPGTVTVSAKKGGAFVVHSLTPKHSEGLLSGDMERRVKSVEASTNV